MNIEKFNKETERLFEELWNEHDGTHFYKDEWKDFLRSRLLALLEARDKELREKIEGKIKEWSIVAERADEILRKGIEVDDYSFDAAGNDVIRYNAKCYAAEELLDLLSPKVNQEK